jgi:tetratricopeptide (TPR) repeat protein
MAEIFVSYTSQDKAWAEWIAWTLNSAGHVARLHNWEIDGGGDILKWMEDRFEGADHVVSVVSSRYLTQPFSALERRAAVWADPESERGLWRPVLIEDCKLPRLIELFKRLPLYLNADDRGAARKALLEFIEPVKGPVAEPPFPGTLSAAPPEPAFPGTPAAIPAPPPSPAPPEPHLFPPDPVMIGRAKEEADLVAAILTGRTPVVIPGGPGMGKTTLAVSGVHDPALAARYEERRYFVPLDAVTSADAMLRALATALGVEATGSMAAVLAAIRERCNEANRLVVLDNAETPLERDQRQVEEALGHLSAAPGLALVITVRGGPPGLPKAEVFADVAPLPFEDAKQLFLRYAVGVTADDTDLAGLLRALDGHALSIRLLGTVAEGQPNLVLLRRAWQQKRAELLQEGEGDHRLRSTRASLRLSLESPRMTKEGRRLLALLALLPGGLWEGDLEAVMPGAGDTAALLVMRLRLAFRRDSHLRMLVPLREAAVKEIKPEQVDLNRLIDLLSGIVQDAERGLREGKPGLRVAAEREAENLDAVLDHAIQSGREPIELMDFARALAMFHSFSGLGTADALTRLADRAREAGNVGIVASCAVFLGGIALHRSDHDRARAQYEQALPLFGNAGDVLGEAHCIKGLGDIALQRSDHDGARARFEEARPLYRKVNNIIGEANCIRSLGHLAFLRSDLGSAGAHFEEALQLYRKIGGVLGEANCIKHLGDIALRRSDYDGALARFEEALLRYQNVGDVLGEANCIQSLGTIALERSDDKGARLRFEQALSRYRKVGALVGEANCIQNLGDIEFARSNYDAASQQYEEALRLYRKVGDVLGEANCIQSIGEVAFRRSDCDGATARYEEALPLFCKVGDLLGEANCMRGLGDVARHRGDPDVATNLWLRALQLYQRIPEPHSIGHTHHRLARVAKLPANRVSHLAAAREAWLSIGRQDLIENLLPKEDT